MNNDELNALVKLPTFEQGELIRREFAPCSRGGWRDDGLDGLALDLVIGVTEIDGELLDGGQILDLVGRIVDQWRVVGARYY